MRVPKSGPKNTIGMKAELFESEMSYKKKLLIHYEGTSEEKPIYIYIY